MTVGVGLGALTVASLRGIVAHIEDLRAERGLSMDGDEVVVEGDSHGDIGEVCPPVEPWEEAGRPGGPGRGGTCRKADGRTKAGSLWQPALANLVSETLSRRPRRRA